jgi:hypothetical protein
MTMAALGAGRISGQCSRNSARRQVIAKILRHLELPVDPPEPVPVQSIDWLPGFAIGTD